MACSRADDRDSAHRLADEFGQGASRPCGSACCRSPTCSATRTTGELLALVHIKSLNLLFVAVILGRPSAPRSSTTSSTRTASSTGCADPLRRTDMQKFASTSFAAVAATSLAPDHGGAAEYTQVQADKAASPSATSRWASRWMDGRFSFRRAARFDPAKPAAAKASFDVELASIDTGSADADDRSRRKALVQHRLFPPHASSRRPSSRSGRTATKVAGTLTIKGQSREIVVPASFSANGNAGAFDGSFDPPVAISPSAKAAGRSSTSSPTTQIRFHIAASASAPNGTRK